MEVVTAKDVFSEYMEGSQFVYKGACWLYLVAISSTDAGASRAEIFDGTDANGALKLAVQAPSSGHKHFKLCYPVYLRYGLYFSAAVNVADGFVQLLPCTHL